MKSILTGALTLSCFFIFAQTTIEFRILSVSSNVDDMDGFLQGDSDPVWTFEMLDGGTNLGSSYHEITENCPGTKTINKVFASRNYSCALPSNFTFRWSGYEDDGWLGTEANTGLQTISIPAGGFTATGFTTIASYSATASGDRCGGGNTVTWGVTLQYRVSGSFLTNTAPTGINASGTIIQTGQNVTLTQVGGTATNGGAAFTWTTGSCNGTVIGTGTSITTSVSGTTTYYVKASGACPTTCAAITITSSALGVTLSDYYYLCNNNQIAFHWRTESETNNSHFEIQQMEAPNVWKTITSVKGHGNSSVTHSYDFSIPNSSENNDHYYRLVQVDKDEVKTEYDPFYIACDTDSKALSIYPNPNNGSWSVYPFEKNLQIRSVRNQVGKSVAFEAQDGKIQLIHPEAGTYFVELISNGQITIQKVIVQ
ncbi:T9SS type A sorting domain-containing protein [Fluviicola sp.]|uniref:T9SS type A sorting domain-containing protein n=1 Tax=Fluviicola sp. TaxID=1917219 RepID=UPI00262DCA6A|nr:T9SS type A sorting domain-containing protein [Fluviicola sp.]